MNKLDKLGYQRIRDNLSRKINKLNSIMKDTKDTITATSSSTSTSITNGITSGSNISNYSISSNTLTSNPYRVSTDLSSTSSWSADTYIGDYINIDHPMLRNIVEDALKKDDELYPIVERYLIKHLEKIMDNPDKVIKELIKEKDTTIKELTDKVNKLEEDIKYLKTMIPYGYPTTPPYYEQYPYNPVCNKMYIGDVIPTVLNTYSTTSYSSGDSSSTTC